MQELVRIEQRDGKDTVNARELHKALGSKQDFSTWVKARLEGFVQDVDFTLHKFVEGKATKIDYYITIDTAKHLAMLERNEKGMAIRNYFIEVEKKAKELTSKPQSQLDILAGMVKALQDQERKQLEHESRLNALEARTTTSQMEYYTVAGYASLRGLHVDVSHASALGRKATALSNEYGYDVGKTPDPRFGNVGTYHLDILKQVFDGVGN